MAVKLSQLNDHAGDRMWSVLYDDISYGTVRDNPRTGDYCGVTTVKGKLKSRYYGTLQGAARWVIRQHRK